MLAVLESSQDEIATPAELKAKPARVLAVDVLRGLTVAFMILVNDPGDWTHLFPALDHAEWNGWTPPDIIFPTFLFLVGMSLVFSVRGAERRRDDRATISGKFFMRAGKIILLGLLIALFPHFNWHRLRLFGVLTRIGLCSLAAGLLFVSLRRARWIVLTVAALLVGYWLLLRFVRVPGLGTPGHEIAFMDPDANLAAWIDRGFIGWTQRVLHCGRLFDHTRDPEGLLSTLPAIASTLLGTLTALAMDRFDMHELKARLRMASSFAGAGVMLMLAGWLWSFSFPINKNLWTSSFVLFMGGWSLLLLAGCSLLVDEALPFAPRLRRAVAWPWLVFGSNAIVAFAVSDILIQIPLPAPWSPPGHRVSAPGWVYGHIFAAHGTTEWTSLAFGIVFTALCFLPNLLLWRRRIFVRL